MRFELTEHAKTVLAEREIRLRWVQKVLDSPAIVAPDPTDKNLEHRLGRISERGNRVLRVIINKASSPVRIVTVYFDRSLRNKV